MTPIDRLSALDSSFLYAESPVAHMHVGSLVVLEDSGFTEEQLHEHISSRLHLVPRFRKKLLWPPYGLGRPVWVDDRDFDLRFHLRYTGLPRPGEMPQALRLMGRVMSIPLDRSRPLWEMWLFDLPGGRKGLIQKTHHCLIDGMSGVALGTVLLDPEPKPRRRAEAPTWTPERPPDPWALLWETWRERLASRLDPQRGVRTALQSGRKAWDRLREVSEGTLAFGKAAFEVAPKTSLNVPIKAHRRFDVAHVPLDRVKAIKRAAGCTVNDVVLAAVAGGLRHILTGRGDDIDGLVLKVMVPVSVRDPSQRLSYGNRVSMMSAELPVGESNPRERLRRIAHHMTGLKDSKQAVGADFWVKLAEFTPATVLSMVGRAVALQRMVNIVVTNVPGPQFPLYLLGGKMLEVYPYVPIVGSMATGVAVMSYNGWLDFGVTGDWDAVPDLDVLAQGIEASIGELEALVA